MANIIDSISSASQTLGAAGIDQPRREALLLLEHCLRRNRAFFIAHPDNELTAEEARCYENVVIRRAAREPFHLIVGRKEFYGLEFEVEAGVLIPRPETELLVERSIEILRVIREPRFFEAGVGTGCICISMLATLRSAKGTGVDISNRALELAARNAKTIGVSDRLTLRRSNLFDGETNKFDMIVANPPYIPTGDAAGLQKEVIDFDPAEALFGGVDGLEVLRRIIAEAPRYLKKGGYLLLEIGHGQSESVTDMLGKDQWANVDLFSDLQGIPRMVAARIN